MIIKYKLRGMNSRVAAARPLDGRLKYLGRLVAISSAQVVLEFQRNAAPAFCASVDLAIPGPDIHAAARDHTLEAAILKATRRLEMQITARKKQQELRLKDREQPYRAQTSNKSRP